MIVCMLFCVIVLCGLCVGWCCWMCAVVDVVTDR